MKKISLKLPDEAADRLETALKRISTNTGDYPEKREDERTILELSRKIVTVSAKKIEKFTGRRPDYT